MEKNKEVENKISRLQNGLQKLIDANAAVADLKIRLTEMQPYLVKAKEESDEMMITLSV